MSPIECFKFHRCEPSKSANADIYYTVKAGTREMGWLLSNYPFTRFPLVSLKFCPYCGKELSKELENLHADNAEKENDDGK